MAGTLKTLASQMGSYFNVADVSALGPDGQNLTIKALAIEPVGENREEKPTLRFVETRKALVLSKGRVDQLSQLFGDDSGTDKLPGKVVNLYVRAGRRGPETALRAAR